MRARGQAATAPRSTCVPLGLPVLLQRMNVGAVLRQGFQEASFIHSASISGKLLSACWVQRE